MSTTEAMGPESRRSERTEIIVLLYALTGGVVWWMVHLIGSAIAVPAACEHGLVWLLNALTAVTALATITALVASEAVRRWDSPVALANGRNRVLGFTAVIINVAALVLILLEGVPNLVLSPCR